MENIKEHLKLINDTTEVKCPKCGTTFKPGVNIDENKLKDEYKKYREQYNNILNELKTIQETIDKLETREQLLKNIFDLLSNYLSPLYFYLKEKTNDFKDVYNLTNIINDILLDVNSFKNYNNLVEKQQEIKNKLVIFNKLNDEKIKKVFDTLEQLKVDYTETIKEINTNNDKLTRLMTINSNMNKLEKITDDLEKLIKAQRRVKDESLKKIKEEFINKTIYDIKKTLSELETELIDINNIKERLDNLNKELFDYEKRLKATTILLDILSPNKGIIGESITGLINEVLERMNEIINKIWTYEIKILPCNIEENDLTFRFPVLINGVKEIPDVSKGSSSIKEIIDLAFKIVAMEYLNMLDYPLILDEFGRTMDPTHRIKAYDVIEDIAKNYFSQIFLVSHFESMYNRFIDTDVIILNNDNVGYNNTYNKVVKLK
jgi:tetrahydromethanopterin S-methyltransferase subunit B